MVAARSTNRVEKSVRAARNSPQGQDLSQSLSTIAVLLGKQEIAADLECDGDLCGKSLGATDVFLGNGALIESIQYTENT
jgi:hypothetical protein